MALKPLLWKLSLTLSASFAAATSFNLSSEITRLVPPCARECFRSHLSANYALTTCGSAPSLQCLCANVGFSGLTIGEGAVQCIVAEKSIGFCRESDAPQTVIDAAYQMCAHQPGAIQPTHTAIIATLILPTSGGIIVVPPRTATQVIPPTSTTHLTNSIPTTLISATGTPSVPNTLTTLTRSNISRSSTTSGAITSPPLPPSSTTTPSSTATPVPGAEEANSEPSERLGTGQVAGLAVGLVAALGLAILAICLARRKRRRDYPDVKTGFFPVREKDSWEFHPQEGPANIFHISPPVHHAQSPPPPPRPPPATRARTSGRTSWWPGAIGLAVSRSESPSTALRPPPPQQDRPTSRLLPAKPSLASPKPVLSLKIPQIDLSSSSPPQPQEQRGSQPTNSQIFKTAKLTAPPKSHYNARESTMTEFEEDGAITSARSALSNNIWRPPSATVGNNPKSATFYVADKNGNWVLGDPKSAAHMAQIAELDASGASEGGGAKVKPSYAESAMLAATATTAGMGHGAGSPVAPSAARMPPPPLLLPAAEIVRSGALTAPPAAHQSRSSSVYSQGTTRPNTGIQTAGVPQAGGAPHPVPSMSFSHPEPPHRRSNSLGRRSSLKSKPGTVSTVPATAAASSTFNAPKRSDSHDSHASATTIASSVASSEPEPVIEQSSLSPVVESPASNASPSGRSPVSYPAIPGRTSSKPRNDNLRLLAPPTRTYGGFPPGQPSPTLGMMQQQRQQARDAPSMASYDVPRKPVARPRPAATDPNRVATGSPSLRLVTPSPPAEAGSLQQEPHWKPAQTQRPPQMRPLYPPPLQPQRPRIESSNFHPQPLAAQPTALPEQSPPPRQPLPERPSSASPSPHHVATQALRPAPNFTPTPAPSSSSSSKTGLPPRPPSPQAASPSVATPSTTSSLLSKRLGSERAAALALPTAGIRHSPNWRPHRPGRAAGAGGGTDMLLSPDAFFPAPPGFPSRSGAGAGDLPSTPTWQPKLTPTRRGDDLFLNVQ
ncbi:Def1-like protein [Colletotrichum tofieldiae]|nr:Def1-like protein [Colletotrichum tofieldiae]